LINLILPELPLPYHRICYLTTWFD